MKNFDNYLFRCSALGNIVTKSGKLTDGAKTYLNDCFIGEIYGVRKEAYGRALEKGVACEVDGLHMLNKVLFPDRFVPNYKDTEGESNEWIKGTCDTIMDDTVYDIKNALDLFTFGKAELNHLYEWQLLGYDMIYDKPFGKLFYCLNNMPDYLIAEEERKLFYSQRKWATMDSPEYLEACEELRKAHNYDHMPVAHRFKIMEVTRTKETDERIISAVKMGREYMNELLKEHNARIEYNEGLVLNSQAA